MRIFVTGATGYIGSSLVRALVQAGHSVTGLARSPEKEAAVRALGATPLRGSLAEPAGYLEVASGHQAFVHTAFEHGPEGVAVDKATVETMLAAAKRGTLQALVFTSGVWVLGNCPTGATEAAPLNPLPMVAWRPAHERLLLSAERPTVAASVIRPGLVYGGKSSLLNKQFESAAKEGAATYLGAGTNRWSLIQRDDLAQLYRKVIETHGRGMFHGVDGAPLAVAEVARWASQAAGAGGATRSIPAEEARAKLGGLADALLLDQVVTAPRSRELGWSPKVASFAQGATAAFLEWKA